MKVGGRWAIDEMGIKTWPAFADSVGIKAPYVLRRVRELVAAIGTQLPGVIAQLTPMLDPREVQRVADLVNDRAARVLERTVPS